MLVVLYFTKIRVSKFFIDFSRMDSNTNFKYFSICSSLAHIYDLYNSLLNICAIRTRNEFESLIINI